METEAGIGVLWPHAKERLEPPEAKSSPSQNLGGAWSCRPLASSPPASGPWRKACLLFQATSCGGLLWRPRETKADSKGFHC